jgi:hypothetical protein
MSKLTRDVHGLVTLDADNTPKALTNDSKRTFRKLFLYPAKDYTVNGLLTANANRIYWAKDGDGPKVFTDYLDTADAAVVITIPDPLPEMAFQDILIYGTAPDGVWFSYVTAHP